MSFIEIINTGFINRDDSAFPTIIKLEGGELICGYSVGGGPEVTGGSDWSWSTDNGLTWSYGGTIMPPTKDPATVNTMRLSKTLDGNIIAYGQRNYPKNGEVKFGTLINEPVYCVADADCRKWSKPRIISHNYFCPVEVSSPMVILADSRWLAPAGLLTDKDHLGEKVVIWESIDEGKSWENEYTVFSDVTGEKGFFEQKIIETTPGNLLAFAWTVELKTYRDLNNHYSVSNDGGRNWSQPKQMPIAGQTLTPLWMGDHNFLLIYNYRQNPQGIKIATANITDSRCQVVDEAFLWQPRSAKVKSKALKNGNGIDSFDDFKFGLPSLTWLDDKTFLAVFWCYDQGSYGIKQIKFKLNCSCGEIAM